MPLAIRDDDPLSMYIGTDSRIHKMPLNKALGKFRKNRTSISTSTHQQVHSTFQFHQSQQQNQQPVKYGAHQHYRAAVQYAQEAQKQTVQGPNGMAHVNKKGMLIPLLNRRPMESRKNKRDVLFVPMMGTATKEKPEDPWACQSGERPYSNVHGSAKRSLQPVFGSKGRLVKLRIPKRYSDANQSIPK